VKARIKRFAVVQPIGHKPFRERADLHYRDNTELTAQLTTYARSKWPLPQKLAVDIHARQIIVDGTPRANFSIHEYRLTPAATGAQA
jgi:mRNA-degrading endonuclease HigB of HigAB toxin-antitoxin module